MRTIGIITTCVAGLAALFAVGVGALSLPDIKRYFRIRSM